tara:strand:+ start:82 stop:696 length:615 start_codon:yes stop_codon:yes gene_type:complete
MISDLIQTIDTLTSEEVTRVLELLDTEHKDEWQPATIFGMTPTQGGEVDKSIRSNERLCLGDRTEAARIMHEALNRALLVYRDTLGLIHHSLVRFPVPGTVNTMCHRERIQILRYQKGQHYSWHHDQATDRNVNEYFRTISMVLYLTEDFEGGRTVFPHRAYKPKAGQCLVFPSNWCFPHECDELISGTKIVAVTWYNSQYNFG